MTRFMDQALVEARLAARRNEVPVGAVIVRRGEVVVRTGNRTIELNDPSAHAEILAIRQAGQLLGNERLMECDLYVTLEPCVMCAGAISFARVKRLYFAVEDIKSGAVENGVRFFGDPSCHHAPEVYSGFSESEARQILVDFFKQRR